MRIMVKSDLIGSDVYEFSYLADTHWSKSSIYVADEDFAYLSKYIDQIIENYPYYGPQKMYITTWNEIKNLVLKFEGENKEIFNFFEQVDNWIEGANKKLDYFWIYGI